jgi:hypothetical protein
MKKQYHDVRGKARMGVFVIPRMMSLGEWEKVAIPHQQRLMELARQ